MERASFIFGIMPLLKEIKVDEYSRVGVWKIEEDMDFFQNKLTLLPNDLVFIDKLKQPQRKLEWFASRWLLRYLIDPTEPIEVESDEFGKQIVKNYFFHISLSHSNDLVAAIISSKQQVGIDIEFIEERIENISKKFMNVSELNSVTDHSRLKQLYLYWSAKEAIYKHHSKRKLDFKRDMRINPFMIEQDGKITAELILDGEVKNYLLRYECFDNYVMVYTTGD